MVQTHLLYLTTNCDSEDYDDIVDDDDDNDDVGDDDNGGDACVAALLCSKLFARS